MNKSKLENGEVIGKIINGIGSPYGEGATYDSGSYPSHLDDEGKEALRKDIQDALNQQRELLIEKILDYREPDGKHLIARNSPFGEFLTKLEHE